MHLALKRAWSRCKGVATRTLLMKASSQHIDLKTIQSQLDHRLSEKKFGAFMLNDNRKLHIDLEPKTVQSNSNFQRFAR